ncbi:MAG: STAS domain-containing protein [Gemmataceae bacterium]
MMASLGTIRYGRRDDSLLFHIQGRGVMAHSVPMRQLAEQMLEAGVRRILFDLRDCTHLDSTFIGTLWTLRRLTEARGLPVPILIAPSLPCIKNLQEMASEDGFPLGSVSDLPPEPLNWTELSLEGVDPIAFRRNAIEAHENLAALEGPERAKMEAVVRCLQGDPPPPPSS